jgi:hypothetical protein
MAKRIASRVIFGLIVGVAAAYVTVSGRQHWDASRWYANQKMFILAVTVVGIKLFWDVVGGVFSAVKDDRSERLGRKLDADLALLIRALDPIFARAVKQVDPKHRDECLQQLRNKTGLHVWLVPVAHRKLAHFRRIKDRVPQNIRRSLPTPRLRLAARWRVDPQVRPSYIKWTRGRGAIGHSWAIRDSFYFNTEERWAKAVDPLSWETQVSVMDQLRLTFPEAQRLKQYGQVMVVPIWKSIPNDSRPSYAGSLVMDLPVGMKDVLDLTSPEVANLLFTTSRSISDQIP